MKGCLEIENNIKNFIEEYNRNYNKNLKKIETKSEYNFNKENLSSTTSVKLSSFYSYLFDNTFTINLNFPRKSLSLNSINSGIFLSKFQHSNNHKINSTRKRQKSKSESDLFDIINHKSCLYYFDETSIENNEDYDEDEDDDVLSVYNHDKYKNNCSKDAIKTDFQTSLSSISNKNENNNHKENKPNFSLKRLFHNSLSTVEEFLSSLNESTTSINVNHHNTSDISSSNASTRSAQPPNGDKLIHVSTISSLVNYHALDDYVDINIQNNKSLSSPSTSTTTSFLSSPILSLSTNNLLINHQNKKGKFVKDFFIFLFCFVFEVKYYLIMLNMPIHL
jgi:hypothetical protein